MAERASTRAEGTYTTAFSRFCSELPSEAIPGEVRDRTKLVILDAIGCGLFGAGLPWSRLLKRTIRDLAPTSGAATVFTDPAGAPPDHAALINGSYIQAFELDDYSREGALHGGALTLPAMLAAASMRPGTTGRDVVDAIAIGFEVGNRVGKCLDSSLILERGWHSGAVFGPPAAAAAAGRVLGLDPKQTEHAFGMAANQAGGLMSAGFGSMAKRMNHGRAAQSGFYAALLAHRGYTGIEAVFDLSYGGYPSTFTATTDGYHLDALTDQLGERFEMENTCIKPYACNASIHPALDAIRAIRARRDFAAGDVASIVVRCTKSTLEHVGWTYWGSGSATTAQMNLSYGLAVMILERDAFVRQYRPELLTSPDVLRLTERTSVQHEPEFDAYGSSARHRLSVEVTFTDGTPEYEKVDFALGSPFRPLADDDIVAKFDKLTETATPPDALSRVKDMVLNLDDLPLLELLESELRRVAIPDFELEEGEPS